MFRVRVARVFALAALFWFWVHELTARDLYAYYVHALDGVLVASSGMPRARPKLSSWPLAAAWSLRFEGVALQGLPVFFAHRESNWLRREGGAAGPHAGDFASRQDVLSRCGRMKKVFLMVRNRRWQWL